MTKEERKQWREDFKRELPNMARQIPLAVFDGTEVRKVWVAAKELGEGLAILVICILCLCLYPISVPGFAALHAAANCSNARRRDKAQKDYIEEMNRGL